MVNVSGCPLSVTAAYQTVVLSGRQLSKSETVGQQSIERNFLAFQVSKARFRQMAKF